MKRYILTTTLIVFLLVSCDLDKDPIDQFSEITIESEESNQGTRYSTYAEMKAAYEGIYAFVKGSGQEGWMLDFLQNTETRADNAYAGATSAEIVAIEQNATDPINKNVVRDWKFYLSGINRANNVIFYIDDVPDPSLTANDRNLWKSEALIMRAWFLFDMVRFYGDLPIPADKAPIISSENIDKVYKLLYPERLPVEQIYHQIIDNLEQALKHAPNVDVSNKFLFSKAVANALLAKVYAEKPVRNYNKTIQYCDEVIADGFTLLPNYRDLFQLNDTKTDVKLRNSSESIFEISYQGGGTWLPGLFGKNYLNPNSRYDWAKWVTPSRDLIAAFDAQNDTIRKNQAIVWGQPSWEIYYPSTNYPFMYKIRSSHSSIIKIRLADILLLKAEALVATGDLTGAATLINQVRARVHLPALSSAITSSADAMKQAVLDERRLELAFEGHRWFDLVRNDKAIEVVNSLNSRDSGRLKMIYKLNENTILYPIPLEEIEKNTNLKQNPGY